MRAQSLNALRPAVHAQLQDFHSFAPAFINRSMISLSPLFPAHWSGVIFFFSRVAQIHISLVFDQSLDVLFAASRGFLENNGSNERRHPCLVDVWITARLDEYRDHLRWGVAVIAQRHEHEQRALINVLVSPLGEDQVQYLHAARVTEIHRVASPAVLKMDIGAMIEQHLDRADILAHDRADGAVLPPCLTGSRSLGFTPRLSRARTWSVLPSEAAEIRATVSLSSFFLTSAFSCV